MIGRKKLLTASAPRGFIVKGKSVLSKPPLWDSPAEIVSPNSFTLTGGGKSVLVEDTLYSVDDYAGEPALQDNITVKDGAVTLTRNVAKVELKGNEDWRALDAVSYEGITWSIFRVARTAAVNNTGLCSHLPLVIADGSMGLSHILYPRYAPYNCCGHSWTWLYVRASQPETGITDIAGFTAWLTAEKAAGTPVTFLCSRAAVSSDITDTPLGQGLLGLRGYAILSSDSNVEIEVIR